MKVEPRKYRFRILNASISRSYDLALSTGDAVDRHRHRRRPDAAPAAGRRASGTAWPSATRSSSTSRSTSRRSASSCRTCGRKNNVDYDQHRQGHGVRGRRATAPTSVEQRGARPTSTRTCAIDGAAPTADAVRTRRLRLRAQRRRTGRSTARPGPTSSTAASSTSSPTRGFERRRDLGARRTRRAAGSTRSTSTSSTSRSSTATARPPHPYELGPKDVVVRRRERDGPRAHALRAPARAST